MHDTGMSILRSEYAKNKISEIADHKLAHESADVALSSPINSAIGRGRQQFENTSQEDTFFRTGSVDTEHVGANILSAEYRQQ